MPRSITPWDDPNTLWDDPDMPWDGIFVPDKGPVKLVSSDHTSRVGLLPSEDDVTVVADHSTEVTLTPSEDDTEI